MKKYFIMVKVLVATLVLILVLGSCGTEYRYYQVHKSHSPKYKKRQVMYKKYQHHDHGVDRKIRH